MLDTRALTFVDIFVPSVPLTDVSCQKGAFLLNTNMVAVVVVILRVNIGACILGFILHMLRLLVKLVQRATQIASTAPPREYSSQRIVTLDIVVGNHDNVGSHRFLRTAADPGRICSGSHRRSLSIRTHRVSYGCHAWPMTSE